jgi:hypothetical protein
MPARRRVDRPLRLPRSPGSCAPRCEREVPRAAVEHGVGGEGRLRHHQCELALRGELVDESWRCEAERSARSRSAAKHASRFQREAGRQVARGEPPVEDAVATGGAHGVRIRGAHDAAATLGRRRDRDGRRDVRENFRVSRSVSDVASTVNSYAPATVGVPASLPVVDSSVSPWGARRPIRSSARTDAAVGGEVLAYSVRRRRGAASRR